MSINPVPGIGSISSTQSAERDDRPATTPTLASEGKESASPVPGTRPKPEVQAPQNVSESAEMPQDEVEVQTR